MNVLFLHQKITANQSTRAHRMVAAALNNAALQGISVSIRNKETKEDRKKGQYRPDKREDRGISKNYYHLVIEDEKCYSPFTNNYGML